MNESGDNKTFLRKLGFMKGADISEEYLIKLKKKKAK